MLVMTTAVIIARPTAAVRAATVGINDASGHRQQETGEDDK
jgi:hypothetical protein